MNNASIFLLFCLIVAVIGIGDMGPGIWSLIAVQDCDEPDKYEFQAIVEKKKIDRKHDVFDATMIVPRVYDELSFGIRVDICIYTDGVCKPYQTLADECACCFMNKYAKSNVEGILTLMGLDPPNCPVPEGIHKITNYTLNYDDMPKNCVYGKFSANTFLIDRQGKEVSCKNVITEFIEFDE